MDVPSTWPAHAPTFDLRATWRGDVCTVVLSGEIDASARPDAERFIEELSDRTPARIDLDLAGVRFIDSAGLHMLIQLRWVHGDGVRLIRRSQAVDRILSITQLADHFT